MLTQRDLEELRGGQDRVYRLMRDGGWYPADAIRQVAGNGSAASEGLRRLRELRKWFEIEKRRSGGRSWEYRLVERGRDYEPQELF